MPKQTLIPEVTTPLMEAAQNFVDLKNEIAEKKAELDEMKDKILIEMSKEGKETLLVTVGGDNYFFEVKHGEDDLRCVKQTRQPLPEGAELQDD